MSEIDRHGPYLVIFAERPHGFTVVDCQTWDEIIAAKEANYLGSNLDVITVLPARCYWDPAAHDPTHKSAVPLPAGPDWMSMWTEEGASLAALSAEERASLEVRERFLYKILHAKYGAVPADPPVKDPA